VTGSEFEFEQLSFKSYVDRCPIYSVECTSLHLPGCHGNRKDCWDSWFRPYPIVLLPAWPQTANLSQEAGKTTQISKDIPGLGWGALSLAVTWLFPQVAAAALFLPACPLFQLLWPPLCPFCMACMWHLSLPAVLGILPFPDPTFPL
jgi:hypothetical protein